MRRCCNRLRWLRPLRNPPIPRGYFFALKFCIAAAVCSTAAGGAYENYENYEIYEICCWGAVCAASPNGNSAPEPNQTAASKPTGYHKTCRGVARQGEDGRTHLCQTGQTSQTSQTKASRPRRLHPPVAIKLPRITLR